MDPSASLHKHQRAGDDLLPAGELIKDFMGCP